METRKEYLDLTGRQKVSAFLLSIPEDQVVKIFNRLEESEIREIAKTMAKLGTLPSQMIEAMFSDFIDHLSAHSTCVGSFESTKRLLEKTLNKEKADFILQEIKGPLDYNLWDKLAQVNEKTFANYLIKEHPKTIAIILTHLRADYASKLLSLFPDSLSSEVIMGMLNTDIINPDVLEEIEKILQEDFTNSLSKPCSADPYERIADVFNYFDRGTEAKIMGSLKEKSEEAVQKIKNWMITFEDISKIDSRSFQSLLRVVDKGRLSIALKGASPEIQERFLKNISERAGKIMREEMQSMGMVRVKEVEDAQMSIITLAKELMNAGEITIRKTDEEELIG